MSREWLAVRLVFAALLIGSALSMLSAAVLLSTSFSRQKDNAIQVLDQIEAALADALQQALWTLDVDQVEVILDGMKSVPNVAFVELVTATDTRWARGTPTTSELERRYEFNRSGADGTPEYLGTLRVVLTVEEIVDRLWSEFWALYTSNLGKAYLGTLTLLYLVHRVVTRHLRKIVRHVNDPLGAGRKAALTLDRQAPLFRDDLDDVVAAINRAEERTRATLDILKSEVSERIQAEREARQALSIRSKFLGTMSHEVRTPLNSILGLLHLIETNDAVPQKQRHYAEVATKAAHQLLNQLSNALDLSRLESQTLRVTHAPIAICPLSEQWRATAEANAHFRRKDISVLLECDPELDSDYLIDSARLTQIVTNLTDNAIKLTQAGKVLIAVRPLSLEAGAPGHGLQIAVSDTGPGIAQADRLRIFERFAQLDDSIERTHGGAGLGLAISLEMAHRLGASLTVQDVETGGYATTFLLSLDFNCRLEAQSEDA